MLVLNALIVIGGVVINYTMLKSGFGGGATPASVEPAKAEPIKEIAYDFFPVEKIIISLRDNGREHYFVLDLILQAEASGKPKKFEQIEPIVRNSVVTHLSALGFEELRALQITELQTRLEEALFNDFASMRVAVPFKQILVSKLIVQ
jgi:flagellar FliL protein